jgi:hypothetical protein
MGMLEVFAQPADEIANGPTAVEFIGVDAFDFQIHAVAVAIVSDASSALVHSHRLGRKLPSIMLRSSNSESMANLSFYETANKLLCIRQTLACHALPTLEGAYIHQPTRQTGVLL